MTRRKGSAKAVLDFIQSLHHWKGEWAGQPFTLMPWQRKLLSQLFGTVDANGLRQYRTAYIEIPKKNGKSHLAAGVALYLLTADGEPGAEIYGAAFTREQASIVYDIAVGLVKATPELAAELEVVEFRKRIVDRATGSFYQVLSRETLGSHGYNPHGIIFDEVHTQRTRELWDTLTQGTAARRQPLTFAITTAGIGTDSLCTALHDYSRKVLNGSIRDPKWLPCISGAELDEDWTDPKVWRKANPSFGVTVSEEYLREQCGRAKEMPSYQNAFRRFHLNQWVQSETRWLDLTAWDACAGKVDPEVLLGRTCYGGLDLAATSDINAFVLVFPPLEEREPVIVLPTFWVPEERILERARRDRVPYDAWARDGWLRTTPGNVSDYRTIVADIAALGERYRIAEIAFDRWGAQAISNELQDLGFTMVQFGQGFVSMSAPSKELERLVVSGGLRHGGHPVLRWMVDNVVIRTDPAANIKPDREKSSGKIDGVVALVMALDRATLKQTSGSIYETRGLLYIDAE